MRAPLLIAAATAALSASLAIFALTGPPSAQAAAAVIAQETTFSPPTLTVPAGTTVTWTNTDQAAHTVTADDGSFDTGFVAAGQTVSLTFATPGTYPYYCIPHGAPGGAGMAGVVVVQ